MTCSIAGWSQTKLPDARLHVGRLLYADEFSHGLEQWHVELEKPGRVAARSGTLEIDVPAGVTVWFRHELKGPLMIQYEATVIANGGPNDRVSDLNSFWMATDPGAPKHFFARGRFGRFADYNALRLYYVGLGGNGNTTTRFRRYIGSPLERPLLPSNDLSIVQQPQVGLIPNRTQIVTLIADGNLIQYWRDNVKLFESVDPEPYLRGWFGIRTTQNHMQVRHLRVVQLTHKFRRTP